MKRNESAGSDATETRPRLSVLVCTYGEEGIRRVADADYPVVNGVEYCVSWQLPEGDPDVPDALRRPDVRIAVSRSRGLSKNRNLALKMARGEISLISDDDVRYVPRYFENLFEAFANHPEADIITFKYDSAFYPKPFPDHSFDLRKPPRFYFTTSFEIAFKTASIRDRLRFDENFGIGARWIAGEEDIFIHDAKKAGLNLRFIPQPVARHDGSTTSDRERANKKYVETKGAVMRILFPATWPLRMLRHLPLRDKNMSASTFILSWTRGALSSKRSL